MKRKKMWAVNVLILCFFLAGQAWAHTPLCSCYDNGDGTVTCEGGFFDKPKGAYKVIFDGGEGHMIEIDGKEIVE